MLYVILMRINILLIIYTCIHIMSARNKKLVAGEQSNLRQRLAREASQRTSEGSGYDRVFAQRRAAEQALDRDRQAELEARMKNMNPYRNKPTISSNFDIHEQLKEELNRREDSIIDDSNYRFQIDRPTTTDQIPLSVGVSDKYFYVDTANTNVVTVTSDGKIVFDINKLSSLEPIENIIEIEIGEFSIPYYYHASAAPRSNGLAYGNNTDPAITDAMSPYIPSSYYNSRITLLLEEMQTQSIVATDNQRFHFIMNVKDFGAEVDQTGSRIALEPVYNKYTFTKPIRAVGQLTFRMSDTLSQIPFPPSIINAQLQNTRPTYDPITTDGRYMVLWLDTDQVSSINRTLTPGVQHRIRFTNIDSIQNIITGDSRDVTSTLAFLKSTDGFLATMYYVIAYPDGFPNQYGFFTNSTGRSMTGLIEKPTGLPASPNNVPPYQRLRDETGFDYGAYWYPALYVQLVPGLNDNPFFPQQAPYFAKPYSIFKNAEDEEKFHPVQIEIMSRRVAFPIKLRTLRDLPTNHIVPV